MSGFNIGSGTDVDISYLESSRSEPSNGFDRHLTHDHTGDIPSLAGSARHDRLPEAGDHKCVDRSP